MGGFVEAVFGGGERTSSGGSQPFPPSAEELELIKLNTELTRKQLANLDSLAPFQKALIEQSLAELSRQGAINGAVSPEEEAGLRRTEFERAQRLGPVQDRLLQMQLDALEGKISPELEAQLQSAADSAIEAGNADIDIGTQRGIGMISDEVANARGLRLTDTPIMREATLLTRAAGDQKASLAKSIRSNQMSTRLGLSSQVFGMAGGMGDATKAFQDELRNRASANRMALFGQTGSGGIGLASVGSGAGVGTLGALTSVRGRSTNGTEFDPVGLIGSYGNLSRGIGSMMGGGARG